MVLSRTNGCGALGDQMAILRQAQKVSGTNMLAISGPLYPDRHLLITRNLVPPTQVGTMY